MADRAQLVHERSDLLAALADDGLSKPELVDATRYARSTVDRAIRELSDADLVERDGPTYRATALARRLLSAHDAFVGAATTYHEHRELVDAVPADEPFPPVLLAGAEVESGTPDAPTAPLRRGFVRDAASDVLRTTCPVMLDLYDRYMYERVVEHGTEVEVVFTPAVLETIEAEYAGRWRDVVETGLVTAYVSDSLPSYAFYLADGVASAPGDREFGAIVLDGERVHAVTNYADAALAWADERWAAVLAGAEQVYPEPE